jgi:hypothetical protein
MEGMIMSRPLKLFYAALLLAGALLASGCGTTPGDRMLSGGLLGAAGGAAIGSVTGDAGAGAVVGGVAGAAIGGLTRPRDVYLGSPPWRGARCVDADRYGRCERWR